MLLALDTATLQAGLALYDGQVVRAEALWHGGRHHTEWLAPAVDDALRRIHATAADLTAVAVTRGPGSFTGLRVAMSLGKGIAAARGLPIVGISALDVTAAPHAGPNHPLFVLLPSGRGRHAYASYPAATGAALPSGSEPRIGEIQAVAAAIASVESAAPIKVAGELTPAERMYLAEEFGERLLLLSPAQAVRRPAVLAELAWQRLAAGEPDELATLEPIYLHHTPPAAP